MFATEINRDALEYEVAYTTYLTCQTAWNLERWNHHACRRGARRQSRVHLEKVNCGPVVLPITASLGVLWATQTASQLRESLSIEHSMDFANVGSVLTCVP